MRAPTCSSGSARSPPTAAPSPAGRPSTPRCSAAPGVVYYDDNLWIALALVGSSSIVGGQASRDGAQPLPPGRGRLGRERGRPLPGRRLLDALRAPTTTATRSRRRTRRCSRSGSTSGRGSPAYLAWAQSAYAWTKRCLGHASGLVADHIDLGGKVDPHTWSYNQGAMIAAGVRLYRATGGARYLDDATRTANAALRTIGDPLASGEPPVFLAIFYRDLLELTAVVPGRDRSRRRLDVRRRGVAARHATRRPGSSTSPGAARRCSTRRRWCRCTPSSGARATSFEDVREARLVLERPDHGEVELVLRDQVLGDALDVLGGDRVDLLQELLGLERLRPRAPRGSGRT